MTFVEFVAETELGRGYVSELERGLVVPSLDVLGRVAAALGVDVCDVVLLPEDSARQHLISLTRHLRQSQLRGLLKEVEEMVKRTGSHES